MFFKIYQADVDASDLNIFNKIADIARFLNLISHSHISLAGTPDISHKM